jgi:hypothetical protein
MAPEKTKMCPTYGSARSFVKTSTSRLVLNLTQKDDVLRTRARRCGLTPFFPEPEMKTETSRKSLAEQC